MAVRALLHYALEVPDRTVGETFYRAFGLVEESADDDIPEHCAWQPRDFPEGDALYRWGPPVPEDFGVNRELEG